MSAARTADEAVEGASARALSPERLRQIMLDLRLARGTQEREAAPCLGRPSPASTPPEIDPVRLANTLARVGRLRRAAWADGAFLNVWSAARLGRDELRNTRVLAWWLDPRGPHGLGPAFLSAFLALIPRPPDMQPPPDEDLSQALVGTERQPHGDDANRIDVEIDTPSLLIWIEAKIDAGEGQRQLERYAEAAGRMGKPWRLVYLSRSPPVRSRSHVNYLTWRDLAQIARSVAENRPTSIKMALAQYADFISSFKEW